MSAAFDRFIEDYHRANSEFVRGNYAPFRVLTTDKRALSIASEARLRAGAQRLLDAVTREQVYLVIFGHDGEQSLTLNTAPAFYD